MLVWGLRSYIIQCSRITNKKNPNSQISQLPISKFQQSKNQETPKLSEWEFIKFTIIYNSKIVSEPTSKANLVKHINVYNQSVGDQED